MTAPQQILCHLTCLVLAVVSGRRDRAGFFLAGIVRAVILRDRNGRSDRTRKTFVLQSKFSHRAPA